MECFTFRHGVRLRKRGYGKRKVALSALYKTAKRRGWNTDRFNVYKCSRCRQYHIGRKRRDCDD